MKLLVISWTFSLLFCLNVQAQSLEACPKSSEIADLSKLEPIDGGFEVLQGKLLIARDFNYLIHNGSDTSKTLTAISEDFNQRGLRRAHVECADLDALKLKHVSTSFPVVVDIDQIGMDSHSFWFLQALFENGEWRINSSRSRLLSEPERSRQLLKQMSGRYKLFADPVSGGIVLMIRGNEQGTATTLFVNYDLVKSDW